MSRLRFCDAPTLRIFVFSWPRTFHILPEGFPTEPVNCLTEAYGSLMEYSSAVTRTKKTAKNASCVPSNHQARLTHPQTTSYKCLDTAVSSFQKKLKKKKPCSTCNVMNHRHPGHCRKFSQADVKNQRSSVTSPKYLLKIGVHRTALLITGGTASNFNLKTPHICFLCTVSSLSLSLSLTHIPVSGHISTPPWVKPRYATRMQNKSDDNVTQDNLQSYSPQYIFVHIKKVKFTL